MISTGAAAVDVSLRDRRRDSPGRAPVLSLPRSVPPAALVELLRRVDELVNAKQLPDQKRAAHATKVVDCGEFFLRARCGCGKRLLPKTCKDRLCPSCERARAAKAVSRYVDAFEAHRWVRHVVFTARKFALGELAASIDFLHRSLRKLRHSKLCRGFLEGGTTSIETKGYAPSSTRAGWHTHAHVLAWGTGWVPISALCLKWCQVTGGRVDWKKFHALPESVQRASAGSGFLKRILSSPDADAYGCVEKEGRGRIVHAAAVTHDVLDGYRPAMQEALKYVTKSPVGAKEGAEATAGWTPAMAAEFYAATRNRNLFQKFGDCPPAKQLEALLCQKCGLPVEVCGGHFAHALPRDDAERWAAAPDHGRDVEGFYTEAQLADYGRRIDAFLAGPAP